MHNLVGQQLGNYRIVELLGQGGFAEIYNNNDIKTVQQVSTAGSPGAVSTQTLNKLKATVGVALSPDDVATIKQAITNLGADGETRLKAAFFYGDVTHFFP